MDRDEDYQGLQEAKKRDRTGPRQFLREVRGELRRVAWPNRREVLSYSFVVLVTVTLFTAFVAGVDYAFFQIVLRVFGS